MKTLDFGFKKYNMLIPFNYLIKKYHIKPTGVLHIGANTGQEASDYLHQGINKQIWIEAIPETFKQLKENVSNNESAICINACVSDIEGQELNFNIANNEGQSSSLFEFGTHSKEHPEVKFIDYLKVKTRRVDNLLYERFLDLKNYDFLNIDIQGAELLALKGMGDELKKINFAYIEVNEKELYKGCPLVKDIDEYLFRYGLKPREVQMTNFGWGDKFYMR